MAGDLIPPPSPAGRPPPDPVHELRADTVVEPPPPAAEPVAAAPAPRAAPPFRARFGFVFGALAGVAVCAAALTAALITTSGGSGDVKLAENWSEWKPESGDTFTAAQDIASHVGAQYRRDDGDQLVAVQAGPIAVEGLPAGVAIRPQGGAIELLDGDGLLYVFDGLGPAGALAGKPTEARGSLLRREALELALYTFRYIENITMVAVMMPPPAPERTQSREGEEAQATTEPVNRQALFYRPGDLLPQLQVPLVETLPAETPRPRTLSGVEASEIDSLTLGNVFVSEWRRAQGGPPYLVLQEPDAIE